jgi:rhamnopyranosyl-N-acetylglucosaminyl-diphospho-decaprenol beta-1,3/1,4-galactofuranosyltransferase
VIGVPDLRLFVRGDEVEMHRRIVRSGLPFGTALRAAYLHPAGIDDDKPMLGGRMHARDPDDPVKRYYTFRNRGYLVSQPGMRQVGLLEVPRFTWYFLVTKRSPREFAQWLRLVRRGRAEHFDRA